MLSRKRKTINQHHSANKRSSTASRSNDNQQNHHHNIVDDDDFVIAQDNNNNNNNSMSQSYLSNGNRSYNNNNYNNNNNSNNNNKTSLTQEIVQIIKANIPIITMSLATGMAQTQVFHHFGTLTLIPIVLLLLERLLSHVWYQYLVHWVDHWLGRNQLSEEEMRRRLRRSICVHVSEFDEQSGREYALFHALEWYVETRTNKRQIRALYTEKFRLGTSAAMAAASEVGRHAVNRLSGGGGNRRAAAAGLFARDNRSLMMYMNGSSQSIVGDSVIADAAGVHTMEELSTQGEKDDGDEEEFDEEDDDDDEYLTPEHGGSGYGNDPNAQQMNLSRKTPVYSLCKENSSFVLQWEGETFEFELNRRSQIMPNNGVGGVGGDSMGSGGGESMMASTGGIPSDSKSDSNGASSSSRVITVYHRSDMDMIKRFIEHCHRSYVDMNYRVPHRNKIYNFEHCWRGRDITIQKNFSNIHLERHVAKTIQNDIRSFIRNRKSFSKFGIPYKRGYLFYGVPGSGKTSTIYAIANEYSRDIYVIRLNELTDKEIVRAIDAIPPKSIVIFEDIDTNKFVTRRDLIDSPGQQQHSMDMLSSLKTGSSTSSGNQNNLGTLLEVLDAYNYLHGCIIIMTSNHPERLDPALIRPGRIDLKIEFRPCQYEQLVDIFKFFTGEDHMPSSLSTPSFAQQFNEKNVSTSLIINRAVVPHINSIDNMTNEILKLVE